MVEESEQFNLVQPGPSSSFSFVRYGLELEIQMAMELMLFTDSVSLACLGSIDGNELEFSCN